MEYSKYLREGLKNRNISQKKLSALTKIPYPTINQYVNGYARPSYERMTIISKFIGEYEGASVERVDVAQSNADVNTVGMSVKEAARVMGTGVRFVQQGLKDKVFPFGFALKINGSSRWTYFISRNKFNEYMGIKS